MVRARVAVAAAEVAAASVVVFVGARAALPAAVEMVQAGPDRVEVEAAVVVVVAAVAVVLRVATMAVEVRAADMMAVEAVEMMVVRAVAVSGEATEAVATVAVAKAVAGWVEGEAAVLEVASLATAAAVVMAPVTPVAEAGEQGGGDQYAGAATWPSLRHTNLGSRRCSRPEPRIWARDAAHDQSQQQATLAGQAPVGP